MSTISIPPATEVSELISGLLGLDTSECAAQDAAPFSIAEFVNEAGEPVGYIACDLAGGCRLGAALTQIPAGRVDEAITENAMPESLAENLNEVFNISVNLIAPEDGSRVVLGRCVHGESSPDFAELNEKFQAAEQTVYWFEIQRYGFCSFVIAHE